MQSTFTQRMQALRAHLDATNEDRQAFLKGLHGNVHAARANAQALLGHLQKGHQEATERMAAGLKEAQQARLRMREDMRQAALALRMRPAARP